jgi:hypothetical protein
MTISQWFVSGNMSTGRAKVGLKGKEGYFFVGGAQSMAASRTNVPVGLQLTYTSRWIFSFMRNVLKTSPCRPSRAKQLSDK